MLCEKTIRASEILSKSVDSQTLRGSRYSKRRECTQRLEEVSGLNRYSIKALKINTSGVIDQVASPVRVFELGEDVFGLIEVLTLYIAFGFYFCIIEKVKKQDYKTLEQNTYHFLNHFSIFPTLKHC